VIRFGHTEARLLRSVRIFSEFGSCHNERDVINKAQRRAYLIQHGRTCPAQPFRIHGCSLGGGLSWHCVAITAWRLPVASSACREIPLGLHPGPSGTARLPPLDPAAGCHADDATARIPMTAGA